MDNLNYNVAVNLKRIRREKGMSLEGMAEQTGVSKSMLAAENEQAQALLYMALGTGLGEMNLFLLLSVHGHVISLIHV